MSAVTPMADKDHILKDVAEERQKTKNSDRNVKR
jgi:hypothetical protein